MDLSHVVALILFLIGAQGTAVFARVVRPLLDENDSVSNLKLYLVSTGFLSI